MKIKTMIEASLFAAMSAVGARIMIPAPFVPFTLQTLVCMSAGLLLGAKKGAAAMALYMIMGLAGVPVFTSVCGPAAVFAPSFGYIIGFVACAWVCGYVAEKFRRKTARVTIKQYFAAAMAGVAVCYAVGLVFLYAALNVWAASGGATLFKVLSIGLFTTIGGDFIKAGVAAILARRLDGAGVSMRD